MQVTLDGGDASYRALDWTLEARTRTHTLTHTSTLCCIHADVRFSPSPQNLARKGDTVHLVNVIPLDATYSAFNFSPLNIAVSAGDMPVLDPELRKLAVRVVPMRCTVCAHA